MADEPETGGGGGLSRLMDRKVFGIPLPVVGAGVLGVAILAYRLFGSKNTSGNNANGGAGNQFSSTSTYTDPTTGLSTSYTATGNGYLPGQLTYQAGPMPYQQGDVYVNYPAQTNTPTPPTQPQYPDQFDPSGKDIGQYRYGADQVSYVIANIGKYGLTQAIADDIQKSYQAMVAKVGAQQADLYHYSWIGPGNVQAIPKGETNTTQTTTGLPGSPTYGTPPYTYGPPQTYPGTNMPLVTATPGTPGQYGNYPPGTFQPGG